MIRRQARERREYIYRKSIEEKQRSIQERKRKLKNALDENKSIPTELRKDALDLQTNLEYDDEGGDGVKSSIDDEYKWVGVEDPKIMVTTSRDPSSKLKQFAKEVKLIFPNSQRLNRGNHEMKALVAACRANDVTDFIILHEHRGNPDGLIISHLPYGPTAYFNISGCVMRHDIPDVGTMSEVYPHLIFHNFKSKLGERVKTILQALFPVPKDESKRTISFINEDDFISFRHHNYSKPDHKNIELKEIGPRFQLRLYEIKLGTIDEEASADTEWRLHSFMNTAKKRRHL
uniref:U3 small nucleolar ribonucleoprotein protein IMP4-like n=1 Tax=Ciona intestinalis TaxID=7719 RepID=F6TMB1_CIOIN|nr:U3 small nucleolar ribonucleoprotein protein IMP4-like [Ciona intestinalis]|eukprot:XP_002129644.1 U3 small nucleolar ribonucleoprotein protein IMP4-like [Ciona intestinalis]